MLPNQLYYAWYVPWVWLCFFSPAGQGMHSSRTLRGAFLS
jgi:hypothetical protein